jgi:hypothetical protein
VLYVSCAVKSNALKLLFKLKNISVFLCASDFLNVFPRVAEEGACLRLVISIITQTQPTKLVPAFPASHMHTTLVLLDIALALGANLGVQFDPNR